MNYSQSESGSPYKKMCHTTPLQRLHRIYIEKLDLIESKVERLRKRGIDIEIERLRLINDLSKLEINEDIKGLSEGEKDEITYTIERLTDRVKTVEVNIRTPSISENQKKSLTKVNELIDDLFILLETNNVNSNETIDRYLNTCHLDSAGPVDVRFQILFLDCAADDQRRIRIRLESIKKKVCGSLSKKTCKEIPVQQLYRSYIEKLDLMETKVELFRESAGEIVTERESLINTLSKLDIKDLKCFTDKEREEIMATAKRLKNRVISMELFVKTTRTDIQEKALMRVNKLVDNLFLSLKISDVHSEETYKRYLNACHSDSIGPVDDKFQALLLDCTADDQKRIRKRMVCIKEMLHDSTSFLMDVD